MNTRRAILATLLTYAAVCPAEAQTVSQIREARELMIAAGSAYRAGELSDAATLYHRALQLRPDNVVLLYNLAAAQARLGERAAALGTLRRTAQLGLAANPAREPAFAQLQEDPEFRELTHRFLENGRPAGRAEPAFVLNDARFLAEGIAYDRATRRFFVGGVHRRAITVIDSSGVAGRFAPVPEDEGSGAAAPLLGVMGMQVDGFRRRLWAATAAVPEMADYSAAQEGRAEVRAYDVDTGRLLRVYRASDDSAHVFGDLALDTTSGAIYVSDARTGAIFTIAPSADTLALLVAPGCIDSAQGLALTADGRTLIVADYGAGLARVDAAARRCTRIAAPAGLTMFGIDGLAMYQDDIIAVQNYPRPHRVLRLTLDATYDRIVAAQVLLAADPRFDEPTLGTVVDDAFYLVANSQWPKFAPGSDAPTSAPIILRLPLPPAAGRSRF